MRVSKREAMTVLPGQENFIPGIVSRYLMICKVGLLRPGGEIHLLQASKIFLELVYRNVSFVCLPVSGNSQS